jgi:hypothetical protein
MLQFTGKPLPGLGSCIRTPIILPEIVNMKRQVVSLVLAAFFAQSGIAQSHSKQDYRNFPIVLSLQFHSLSFPFKDIKTNFRNVGFGVGTEIALGSTHNWAQQFQVSWYRNPQAGNGILLYTQSAWRPTIVSHVYTEIKAGFGLTYNFRPVTAYRQQDGEWFSVGHKGKWLFTVPLGISLGYNNYSAKTYLAPFVSYQVLANTGYAKSIPIMTNSLIQFGTRVHLTSKN